LPNCLSGVVVPPTYTRPVEVREAIDRRRNIRAFADRPIPSEVLNRIVDAARHAPSSMNEQRWAFVAVTDRGTLQRLAELGGYADHVGQAAAAVCLVIPEAFALDERESIAFDLGQAVQNLMLAAWGEGIGSCHATLDRPDGARDVLGLPKGMRCDLAISLGYPADPASLTGPPRRDGRKQLAEVLHEERW
jgi:nitroreductase